ncbi:AfsR/SARP family transcriptional regulator [Nonomuraea sp. NPDC000554]|uniref:AfsR/SARP family transcriptional regulator n=1 Tax=Nonomuraea sp. NPDC000554 TaxID=3154259 RepID=UPI00332677DD
MLFCILGTLRIRGISALRLMAPLPQAALLALILQHGSPLSREALTQLLWDDPPKSATANLRQHLMRLRQILAEHKLEGRICTLRGSGTSYRLLLSENELDLTEFNALVTAGRAYERHGDPVNAVSRFRVALRMWNGPIDIDGVGSRRLQNRLHALNELHSDVQEDYLRTRLLCEPPDHVIAEIRAFLSEHPLRERGHRLLIRALYESGDTSGALIAFDRARTILNEELGHDPGPDLQRLHAAILRHDIGHAERA